MTPISDQTFVITGANSGIGFQAALAIARQGARVAMICRNEKKGTRARDTIRREAGNRNVELFLADFARLADIRAVAPRILDATARIDVLLNNAGRVVARRHVTSEGFEETLAVNHLSGFLLTQLLLERLLEGGGARIVFTSSISHQHSPIDFDNLNLERGYSRLKAYGRSKLMNLLTAREYHKRYADQGIKASSQHPGGVRTDIWNKAGVLGKTAGMLGGLFMIDAKAGADTLIWLATSDDPAAAVPEGQYYRKRKASRIFHVTDEAQSKLWDVSSKLVGRAES